MLRIVRLSSVLGALIAAWVYALGLPLEDHTHNLVLVAPVLAATIFAAYLLGLLARGVVSFRDCPEEAESLQEVKKVTEEVIQLEATLAQSQPSGDALAVEQQVNAIAARVANIAEPMAKLRNKAAETDPEKKTYGAGMASKVLALCERYSKIEQHVADLQAKAKPAADALRRSAADKAAKLAAEQAQAKQKADKAAKVAADNKQAKQEAEAMRRAKAAAAAVEEKATKEAREKADAAVAKQKAAEEAEDKADTADAKQEADEKADAAVAKQKPAKEAEEKADAAIAEQKPAKEAKDMADAAIAKPKAAGEASQSTKAAEEASQKERAAEVESLMANARKEGRRVVEVVSKTRTPGLTEEEDEVFNELQALQRTWIQQEGVVLPPNITDLPDGNVYEVCLGREELFRTLSAAERVGRLVLVDFNTSWCGPCRAMKPVLERLALEYKGKVAFVAVDCEVTSHNRDLAQEAAIRAFPTFHVYHGLQRKQEFQGGRPQAALKSMLDSLLVSLPPKSGGRTLLVDAIVLCAGLIDLQKAASSEDAFKASVGMLLGIAKKIREHPEEAKFRCIRAGNARFRNGLGVNPNAPVVLAALGFNSMHEAGELVYLADTLPPPALEAACGLLTLVQRSPKAFMHFVKHPPTVVSTVQAPPRTPSVSASNTPAPLLQTPAEAPSIPQGATPSAPLRPMAISERANTERPAQMGPEELIEWCVAQLRGIRVPGRQGGGSGSQG